LANKKIIANKKAPRLAGGFLFSIKNYFLLQVLFSLFFNCLLGFAFFVAFLGIAIFFTPFTKKVPPKRSYF